MGIFNLESRRLIYMPVECLSERNGESVISNYIQEHSGRIYLVDDNVYYYHQPYSVDNSNPPHKHNISAVTDDYEELYRLDLVKCKFDLVCRSSKTLAVVGNHVYHDGFFSCCDDCCCDDCLPDSDSSSSEIEDQLDALNLEDNDEAPSGHDLSLKFGRVRFVLDEKTKME